MKNEKETGECCVCGEITETFCPYCNDGWGKTFFCEEHYKSVVLTGNCCRSNEMAYE